MVLTIKYECISQSCLTSIDRGLALGETTSTHSLHELRNELIKKVSSNWIDKHPYPMLLRGNDIDHLISCIISTKGNSEIVIPLLSE